MDKLRPKKGSQGTVILTNNDNYTVKIYTKAGKNLKMLIKIINFFIKSKIPKTIYKSYYLTEKKIVQIDILIDYQIIFHIIRMIWKNMK